MMVRIRVIVTGLMKKPKTLIDKVLPIDEVMDKYLYPEYTDYYMKKLKKNGFVGECIGHNKYILINTIN